MHSHISAGFSSISDITSSALLMVMMVLMMTTMAAAAQLLNDWTMPLRTEHWLQLQACCGKAAPGAALMGCCTGSFDCMDVVMHTPSACLWHVSLMPGEVNIHISNRQGVPSLHNGQSDIQQADL